MGVEGEVWVQGPTVARGYLADGDASARTFVDGWLRTGDLGALDEDGYLSLTGRIKNLINRGGEKISAEEVENLILTHPAVLNVACVPVDHAVLGEQMCACVVLRPGASLTLPELVSHLRGFELAKHKLPEHLRVFDTFPLSPVGKVSKKDLVAQLRGPEG